MITKRKSTWAGVGVPMRKEERNGGREYLYRESKRCSLSLHHTKMARLLSHSPSHIAAINGSPCQKGLLYPTKNFVLYPKENVNLKNDVLKFVSL